MLPEAKESSEDVLLLIKVWPQHVAAINFNLLFFN